MHMHERLLVISCGRAKTIPIRQRILRKYSEVKKKKNTTVSDVEKHWNCYVYL